MDKSERYLKEMAKNTADIAKTNAEILKELKRNRKPTPMNGYGIADYILNKQKEDGVTERLKF